MESPQPVSKTHAVDSANSVKTAIQWGIDLLVALGLAGALGAVFVLAPEPPARQNPDPIVTTGWWLCNPSGAQQRLRGFFCLDI